jgi:hypothetical protein
MTPVCTLTAAEIEALRADMAEAGAAMRAELARREAEKAGQPAGESRHRRASGGIRAI